MSKQGLLYLAQGDSSLLRLASADRDGARHYPLHHDPIPVTPIDIEDVERGKPRRWKRSCGMRAIQRLSRISELCRG